MKKRIEMIIEKVTQDEFNEAIDNDTCVFANRISEVLTGYTFSTQAEEDEFEEKLFLDTAEETLESTKENLLNNLEKLDI